VARAASAIGAAIIALGGGAIGFALTREPAGGMSSAQVAMMQWAVDKFDGDITKARTAVHEHARTLSAPAIVRRAIATDAQTVADLVSHGELVPEPGEILELGRIDRAGPAGQATGTGAPGAPVVEQLLIVPTGATCASHGGVPGSYVELVGHQIVITEIVEVVPVQDADRLTGFLGVTRSLALDPAIDKLVAAGITGKLVIDRSELAIGTMPAGATTREQPLTARDGARIIAAEPPRRAVLPGPILAGGIAGAAIGVVLLVIGMWNRPNRRPAAGTAEPAGDDRAAGSAAQPGGSGPAQPGASDPAEAPGLAPTGLAPTGIAQTQLSQPSVAASGTPMMVAPGDAPRIVASNLGAGAMIGRWEVLRRLGSGGMADVYLARATGDGGFEKLVAIKVMHSHLARVPRAVDHFLDEARLAARIHHPNVVAIQDLGKIGDDYVIVMEYVEGIDLERLLGAARAAERPVPLAIALAILCRICDGLDAAHRATAADGTALGIVHRDVKSANVLVSRQGVVKVVDFGIAKATVQVHFTAAGETKGTPSMMAPEQRVGDQVDIRADVYSAAAVGYELITGRAVNLDLAQLAHLGVENWPHLPLPSSLAPNLPRELDQILLRAMAFERDQRPASCAALEALCAGVMEAHRLVASDKDIARWVEGELRLLGPAFAGQAAPIRRSPAV
jgi:hypothetical protein